MNGIQIHSTDTAFSYVLDALESIVLPLMRRWILALLLQFQADVVDPAAADWELDVDEFVNEGDSEIMIVFKLYGDLISACHWKKSSGPS